MVRLLSWACFAMVGAMDDENVLLLQTQAQVQKKKVSHDEAVWKGKDRVTLGAVQVDITRQDLEPNCAISAVAWDAEHEIQVEATDHKLVVAVVHNHTLTNHSEYKIFFRNSVGDGEETLAVQGEFFVEAEFDEDLYEEGQPSAATGLVHVGTELSHGGAEWLRQRGSEGTEEKFSAQVQSMLEDHVSNTVVLASLALQEAGLDSMSYPCARPLHLFALQLAKFAELSSHTTSTLISFRANASATGLAPEWDGTVGQDWDASEPRRPYKGCGSEHLGQCGLPGQCWETASGCHGCGCMRGCEYHDHYCTCVGMNHHVCWRMSFGGWEECGPCVGPNSRAEDHTRRRRFW